MPDFPPILGLVGPLGCGKTTTAAAVADLVGGRRISLAGPIRDMLVQLGVNRSDLSDHKDMEIPWLHQRTPRHLMQTLGTDWGRQMVGPNIWVNAALQAAKGSRQPVIVDDVRFDNEADAICAAGGQLLYVHRPGMRYSYTHPSECGLSRWDQFDGLVDLHFGTVHLPSDYARTLLRRLHRRPWPTYFHLAPKWAFPLVRRFIPKREPAVVTLMAPSTVAFNVVSAWNQWTDQRATAHCRDKWRTTFLPKT